MTYIQKRFDCHLIKIRILKFFFQILSMIKTSCKRNFRIRLRIKSFMSVSFFQPFLSNPLSFFLLLASLGFLFQVLSLSLRSGINNSFWMFHFILVSITFLKSFCFLYLHKRISLLKEYIILPIVLFFLGVHFYILLFVLDSRLDFSLFNSIFIWRYALKTVRGIGSKILLFFPLLALLTWKLSLFDSKIPDLVLFFSSAVLVLSKKSLFKKKFLFSESLNKSQLELEKTRTQKEQLDVLESLQEAVILFTPALKLHYSNPYLSRMILSASTLISPSQLETEVLSIRQDDKYVQLKGLALRNEAEFLHLIKALKSKMTLFTSSLTEFNEESSNTSYFSRKTMKTMLTGQKRRKKSRETRKSKVESFIKIKDSNKEISVKEFEKIKLKGLHFLNKNNQTYQPKSLKTLPDTKTLREILRSFLDLKSPDCHFFAQAKEPGKILLVSMGTIETGVLVLIKCIDRKDPLLTIWDNYEVQNKLLASMCHELRTPLNSITNMLELMDGCEEENESQIFANSSHREYLSTALLNSKLLMSNINDFLDYFSLGSRMFELHCKAFDIQKLLIECEIIFRPFAMKKIINFFLHIPEADSFICRNDEERTKQIIFNLLNNAFKFTVSMGTILVQLKIREEYFEIVVQDTGTGIEPERLKTLGNFKANSLNGLSVLGGFGLAISNHLANYVGPKEEKGNVYRGIKVRTEKDKGSRFSFLVDKHKKRTEEFESLAETTAIEKKSRNIEHFTQTHRNDYRFFNPGDRTDDFLQVPDPTNCQCRKILAVDDNDFNLFVLREHFKKKDFEIDTCPGGVEAVTLVEEILIDTSIRFCNKCRFYKLILMDIDMPVKNGYETTKEIRELLMDSGIDVNIVALSAFCQEEAKEKAYEAGIEDYIEKPFSPAKMEYLIDTYL